MPPVQVVFYQENDKVFAQEWLSKCSNEEQDACYERLETLRARGYELRFPLAEHLDEGIWELRQTGKIPSGSRISHLSLGAGQWIRKD